MKKLFLIFSSFTVKKTGILLCAIFFIYNTSNAQGIWTWMGGDTTSNSGAIFGTQGVPSVNNHPPALYSPLCWTDLQGNFWLYGGAEDASTTFGDLWEFNPATLEWTWVMGIGTNNVPVQYGTLGVASPTNTPGSRSYTGCTWVDTGGNLWFYGGLAMGSGSYFSDMWEYNIASNQWTWMSGANYTNQPAVYGTQRVPAATNTPGNRGETGSPWEDANGKFWMYAGATNQNAQTFADMWMYDPVTNWWTWESGSQNFGVPAVYGVQGVFAPANTPGRRWPYAMITENNGNFLLFGGGNGPTVMYGDLWEYNPAINQWAWLNGTQTTNATGVAGAVCQSDATFYPDDRFENRAVWKDCSGNFWMYGGSTSLNTVNGDMWVYLAATKNWARMSAGSNTNKNPVNGMQGVPALTNNPGARRGCAHWKDKNGNFWISGGFNNNTNVFGSMWRYTPDSVCVNSKCSCVAFSGTVSSSLNTVCEGSGQKSALTVTDSVSNLQWQSSPDSIHFSNLTGDTSSNFTTPPTLAQTTYYRVFVKNNCGTDSSNIKAVHILPSPIAKFTDTIKGTQVIFNSDSSSKDVTTYSWNFGDNNPLNTLPNPTHTFSAKDTFYVCLTVYNGSNCSYTLCKNVDLNSVATSINSFSSPPSIQLYPNPANNTLNISVSGIEGDYELKIYNVLGQLALQQQLNIAQGNVIPVLLENFAEGAYELILTNGNQFFTKRFIHLR